MRRIISADGRMLEIDHHGLIREVPDTAGMMFPVRCTWCHRGVYDLAKVEVTARYADCSMWKAPCCGVTVDDRGETGWKSRKDYERLPVAPIADDDPEGEL